LGNIDDKRVDRGDTHKKLRPGEQSFYPPDIVKRQRRAAYQPPVAVLIARGVPVLGKITALLRDYVPGYRRLERLPGQLLQINPFGGDCLPARVPIFWPGSGRPTTPFPHLWNYQRPIEILESYFWQADNEPPPARHNRYLDMPGFAPILVTRDPAIIRAITTETGDQRGQFDRDTLPSTGIARATGVDTLLYANGALWKRQRKLAASPFGKTTLFQPEKFQEFAETFEKTILQRVAVLQQHLRDSGQSRVEVRLEPEIKAVMLELLANNFFGARISYTKLRSHFVPALEHVIDHIVRDSVANKIGLRVWKLPALTAGLAQLKRDYAAFDELTDLVLAARQEKKGLWGQFKSDAPDEALRSNLKVFLAGALEATTSYASWAISHLARDVAAQEKVFQEVKDVTDYTPENLGGAKYLGYVLEETLRLTPSLYFLPRRDTIDTWVEASDGRKMFIPQGTHVLLDVWHANRHEDHWGVAITGYPAQEFAGPRLERSPALRLWPWAARLSRQALGTVGSGTGGRSNGQGIQDARRPYRECGQSGRVDQADRWRAGRTRAAQSATGFGRSSGGQHRRRPVDRSFRSTSPQLNPLAILVEDRLIQLLIGILRKDHQWNRDAAD
jgi:cytochrome P450